MQFSTSIEYAVHGLIYMADRPPGSVLVGDIARAIKAPESYLRKVLQQLARGGLLSSHRGVRGGFSLARDASAISLRDVVEAMDGHLPTWCCAKEKQRCSDAPCPVADAFEEARQKMAASLEKSTIGALARGVAKRTDDWLAIT